MQFAKYVGFKVAAIARGPFKAEVAKRLGVHFYIDSAAQDVAAELQKLGGASVILATAANSESQSRLVGGLMPRGELVIAGPGGETPLAINGLSLIIGEGSVNGTLTGSSHDSEATLAFSALQGIRAMVETMPLIKAEEAYRRMLSNQARFRMVLVTGQ